MQAIRIRLPEDAKLRRAVCVSLIALTAMACGVSEDLLRAKPGPPVVVTPAQASGVWTFTLTSVSGVCAGGGLPAGSTFQATLNFGPDGKIVTEGSFWKRTSTSPPGQLTGSLQVTTGLTDLTFLGSTAAAGAQLTGMLTASGSFTGQLKDPASGLSSLFTGAPCQYNATGVRTQGFIAV